MEGSNNRQNRQPKFVVKKDISLMDLNYDCLREITKYLDIFDLLSIREVSSCFAELAASRFKTFSFNDFSEKKEMLELKNVRNVLQFIGPYCKSLKIDREATFDHGHVGLFDCLDRYCSALETLKIFSLDFKNTSSKTLLPIFKRLKSLWLDDVEIGEHILRYTISNSKTLKHLTVGKNEHLTGKFLRSFDTLEVLVIYECFNLEIYHFVEGLLNHKNFRKLDIQHSSFRYSDVAMENMIGRLKLDELIISSIYRQRGLDNQIPKFGKIESLRKFTINFYNGTACAKILENFAELNQLEELSLKSGYIVEGTMAVVTQMQNLKVLKLFCITSLSSSEVTQITKLKNLETVSLEGSREVTNMDVKAILEGCRKVSFLNVRETFVNSDVVALVAGLLKSHLYRPKLTLVLGSQYVDITNPEPELLQLLFQ